MNIYKDIENFRINAGRDYNKPSGEAVEVEDLKPNTFDYVDNIPVWEPSKYFKTEFKRWGCFSSIISGSSRSGKSFLLKHLLTQNNNELLNRFDFIVVFSPTLTNGFYHGFIKSKLMFETFDNNIILKLKNLHATYQKQKKRVKWLVILDDCADSKSKYINDIQNLYFSGRHSGASVIFLTQKCSLTSTGWLANTTLFISLFAGSRREKEYLSRNVIADVIDSDFPEKNLTDLERTGTLIHTRICQNFQALIILPYNDKKMFKYRA